MTEWTECQMRWWEEVPGFMESCVYDWWGGFNRGVAKFWGDFNSNLIGILRMLIQWVTCDNMDLMKPPSRHLNQCGDISVDIELFMQHFVHAEGWPAVDASRIRMIYWCGCLCVRLQLVIYWLSVDCLKCDALTVRPLSVGWADIRFVWERICMLFGRLGSSRSFWWAFMDTGEYDWWTNGRWPFNLNNAFEPSNCWIAPKLMSLVSLIPRSIPVILKPARCSMMKKRQ